MNLELGSNYTLHTYKVGEILAWQQFVKKIMFCLTYYEYTAWSATEKFKLVIEYYG
jgi:hypothetical protein